MDVHRSPSIDSKKEAAHHDLVRVSSHAHGGVELERRFGFFSCLGLAFALLNSWTGPPRKFKLAAEFAADSSLPVGLPSGGSVAMVWGLIVSAVGTLLTGLSLAEVCHVFPMSGGQYDWTYCLAPKRMKNGLSFFVGWMACAGWTSLFAAASSLGAGFCTGLISLWKPDFVLERYHTFLLYLAFVAAASCLNTFGVRLLPHIDRFAGTWAFIGLITVCVTLLACSSGQYQSPKLVFAEFTNQTGWPGGFAFILGLLQSVLGLTAFDAASHMVEEMPQPARNAPRIMVMAIAMGAVTSWIFMVVILFCLRDFDAVIGSPVGALLEIYVQATENRAGATCLLMFNLVAMFTCIQAVNTVASRMLLSFARDNGLGRISPFLAPVHPRLMVPVWCIAFVTGWVVVFGLIYLGSSVALNAILSAAILFVQLSYIVPILLVLIRGESAFAGHSRSWSLGRARRPINALAVGFNLLTSTCFIFPPALPVETGSAMNYAVVVLAVVLLMCGVTWAMDGRKHFVGPADLEDRLMAAKNA